MTNNTGSATPLHRKFDESEALKQIRNRYLNARDKVPAAQIRRLQQNHTFLKQCARHYELGYKDWMIVLAIYNVYLNEEFSQISPHAYDHAAMQHFIESFTQKKLKKLLPIDLFIGDNFTRTLQTGEFNALHVWGFDPRVREFSRETIQRFLRERMRHFELDLPHAPMFADPPGDWPDL